MSVTERQTREEGRSLQAHGIRARLPQAWSGRIARRQRDGREQVPPTVQTGNFAIPIDDDGFGTRVTGYLSPGRIAVMLVEYAPDDVLKADEGIYAERGFSRKLQLADFTSRTLQVARPNHLGMQAFFTINENRLGVLYAVLGSSKDSEQPLREAEELLRSFEFASSPEQEDFQPAPGGREP